MKTCTVCGLEKSLDEFWRWSRSRDGRLAACRLCAQARATRYYQNKRDWHRAYHLKRHYGMTRDEYLTMLQAQDDRCAICETIKPALFDLSVDHDHDTGRVRGLLCNQCNRGLGLMKDDPKLLRKAASYLEADEPGR